MPWDRVHVIAPPVALAVAPSGHYLYAADGQDNTVSEFAIGSTGALTPVEYVSTRGSRPRSFAIDPSGRFLFVANVETQNVIQFRIDPMTGRLAMTGTILPVPYPNSVKFAPAQ